MRIRGAQATKKDARHEEKARGASAGDASAGNAHLLVDLRLHEQQVLLLAADLRRQVVRDALQHPLQLGLQLRHALCGLCDTFRRSSCRCIVSFTRKARLLSLSIPERAARARETLPLIGSHGRAGARLPHTLLHLRAVHAAGRRSRRHRCARLWCPWPLLRCHSPVCIVVVVIVLISARPMRCVRVAMRCCVRCIQAAAASIKLRVELLHLRTYGSEAGPMLPAWAWGSDRGNLMSNAPRQGWVGHSPRLQYSGRTHLLLQRLENFAGVLQHRLARQFAAACCCMGRQALRLHLWRERPCSVGFLVHDKRVTGC